MVPTAGYYGTKKGCAPVQLIYNIKDARVYAVNETAEPVEVMAFFQLLDADSQILKAGSKTVKVNVREPLPVFDLSANKKQDTFLALSLSDAEGNPVADNFYCLPAQWNSYKWNESNWYLTPITRYADLRFVTRLPAADVRCETTPVEDGYQVTVTNDSDVISYQNILTLKDDAGKVLVPTFWSDNFFSLLPHESKVVTCRTDLLGTVGLTNWNH